MVNLIRLFSSSPLNTSYLGLQRHEAKLRYPIKISYFFGKPRKSLLKDIWSVTWSTQDGWGFQNSAGIPAIFKQLGLKIQCKLTALAHSHSLVTARDFKAHFYRYQFKLCKLLFVVVIFTLKGGRYCAVISVC